MPDAPTMDEVEAALAEIDDDERVTVNDDGTKTVTLDDPVEHKGSTIEKLTFRKPRGKDWRVTDEQKGDIGKAFALAASTSGVSLAVFDKMSGDDAMFCSQVAGSMGKKSRTGGTS